MELSLFSEPTKQAGQYKTCVSLTQTLTNHPQPSKFSLH